MRKSDRQNALAVAAVALCFMLTLGLAYLLGGEGFLLAFNQSDADEKCYLLCGGAYENVELAREAAELVKTRGGAGYVIVGEECEVVLAAYLTLEDAEKVLDGGGGGTGAYLKEVPVGAFDTAALGDDIADETESALGYFSLSFDCFTSAADGLSAGTLTASDVRIRLAVCRARVEELRTAFSDAAREVSDARATELKLALVTALALIDNVIAADMYGSAAVISSLRYQSVQLALCREALLGVWNA